MAEKRTVIKMPVKIKGLTTGKTTFKTGVHKTRKDRIKSRKDKYGKRDKKNQVNGT